MLLNVVNLIQSKSLNQSMDALVPYCVDGIVLAGYMVLWGRPIARYEHKILNIHPALYCCILSRATMVINMVDAGVKNWGLYRSFCRCRYGYRSYIMQNTVPVYPDDAEDTLSERLLP